jgi:protein transport protein SEC20
MATCVGEPGPEDLCAMPPLPTTATFNDEAQQLIDYLERSQKDIHTFQMPRLRQCSISLAEQQKLAAELREDMQTFARRVEVSIALKDLFRQEYTRIA